MPCDFDEAWIGRCGDPRVEGSEFCERHSKQKCWCGAQAVRNCEVAVSLVCGQPLCKDHECNAMGGPFTGAATHSVKGRAQFEEWKRHQGD